MRWFISFKVAPVDVWYGNSHRRLFLCISLFRTRLRQRCPPARARYGFTGRRRHGTNAPQLLMCAAAAPWIREVLSEPEGVESVETQRAEEAPDL